MLDKEFLAAVGENFIAKCGDPKIAAKFLKGDTKLKFVSSKKTFEETSAVEVDYKNKDPFHTKLGSGPELQLTTTESESDVLAKMYRFMVSEHQKKKKINKKELSYSKELEKIENKRVEELISLFTGKIAIPKTKKKTNKLLLTALGAMGMLFSSDVMSMMGDLSSEIARMGLGFGGDGGIPTDTGGTGGGSNAKIAMNYFMSQGWTKAQAAGIVGNLQHESGKNLKITSYNEKEKAYGIAQWHPDRQEHFRQQFGHDIKESNLHEQLQFVQWELTHTHKLAGKRLATTTDPKRAAIVINESFEVSKSSENVKSEGSVMRQQNAEALMDVDSKLSQTDEQPTSPELKTGTGEFKVSGKTGGVDPRLLDIISQASKYTDYSVNLKSGMREGDTRFHGKGMAADVSLYDPKTKQTLKDYQDPKSFSEYEKFARIIRRIQMEKYPELNKALRWGGYFSGGKGKYGALDLMHFDLGGEKVGMVGGSWEKGLTPEQRKIWGIGNPVTQPSETITAQNTTTTDVNKNVPVEDKKPSKVSLLPKTNSNDKQKNKTWNIQSPGMEPLNPSLLDNTTKTIPEKDKKPSTKISSSITVVNNSNNFKQGDTVMVQPNTTQNKDKPVLSVLQH